MTEENKERPTVGMLLDIEHIYGESSGRLAPILITLGLICTPILLYVYFSLFLVIPIPAFTAVEVFFSLRCVMIIIGREKHRVAIYKKQLFGSYESTAAMMNIKTIHPDGCCEYLNSRIVYFVCCFNKTCDNEVQRSVQLRKLLENLIGDYDFDCYVKNVNDAPALREYYKKVAQFDRNQAASNFIKMIDHTIDLVEDTSLVTCTIYAIKGYRSDWKNMKMQIDTAINSKVARCYKQLYRLDDADAINDILNRDIDGIVNMGELMRKKYATGSFGTSKVLAYDLPDDAELVQGKESEHPVIPKQTKSSFHVKYKD